jgi:hypothetical protein
MSQVPAVGRLNVIIVVGAAAVVAFTVIGPLRYVDPIAI